MTFAELPLSVTVVGENAMLTSCGASKSGWLFTTVTPLEYAAAAEPETTRKLVA